MYTITQAGYGGWAVHKGDDLYSVGTTLNATLDTIRSGPAVPPLPIEDAAALLVRCAPRVHSAGKPNMAKILRIITGAGLQESKSAIDAASHAYRTPASCSPRWAGSVPL